MKRDLMGINIQYPISQLILNGAKIIETRHYPIPDRLIGTELAIIETPGKSGRFKSRVIGTVIFGKCFKYKSEGQFYKDAPKHHVTPDSPWRWKSGKDKYGWPVLKVSALSKPIPLKKRSGIVYSKNISIPY